MSPAPSIAAALVFFVFSRSTAASALDEEGSIAQGADEEACEMQQTLLQTQFRLGRGIATGADSAEETAASKHGTGESADAPASADLLIPKRMVPVGETSQSSDAAADVVEAAGAAESPIPKVPEEEVATEGAARVEHPTLSQAAEQLAEATASVEAAAHAEQPMSARVTEQLAEASVLLERASSALRRQEACGLAAETSESVEVAHLVPANGLICYQGSRREMDRVFCLLQTAPTRALYPGASVATGSCASRGFDHLEHDPDDCWVNSQKWLRSGTDDLDRWKDAQEAVWHQYNDAEGIEDFMDLRGGMALSGCICLPGSDVMSAMGEMCAEVEQLGLLPLPPLPE